MKNDIIRLECIDITVDGQGVCKKDGLVVFVKEMIPGEIADVKIIADKKNMAYGIIDKLIVSSKHRIKPDCPISYKCGGCDFRYIDYYYQLELKKKILESTFKNAKVDINVNDIIPCDSPLAYRNKVQVPVRDHKFGFYRKFSNDIVEFDTCYVQTDLENNILKDVKGFLLNYKIDSYFRHILIKHSQGTNEVMLGFIVKDLKVPHLNEIVDSITNRYSEIKSVILNLNTRNDNVILGDKEIVLFGNNYIIDEFEGLRFKIAFKSFYQVNYSQMIKLYNKAKQLANVDSNTRLLDLFSGIGTISLFMAKYCKEVTGVEIVKEAVDNAKDNAKLNNITNATFYLDDARADLSKYLKDKDVLIVDPPRKGLSNDLIDSIKNTNINKIVYISCNPATLARDLKLFEDKYELSNAYPVDMFPYSTHVETVVLLSKGEIDSKKVRVEFSLEDMDMSGFQKGATYPQIKEYVQEHTGLKVSSLYISQVKRKCGLDVGQNYNLSKKENAKQPQCPPEKEKAIMEALQHFGMI